MTAGKDAVYDILQPERLTAVVDIGANPIDSETPYKPMLTRRLCTLVGFEPQAEGFASLNARKSDLETYLPYAVGDGNPGILKICQAPGMTSLFTPNQDVLKCFPLFEHLGRVKSEEPVETRTFDSITEVGELDYLKIDVQGSELSIFRNGKQRLSKAVIIHTEVSLVPLYKNQPVIGDIDLELRSLGFIPHMFADLNKRMILPLHFSNNFYAGMNQLLEADAVYVRDFTKPDKMSSEQMKHLAMVAHHCYKSYDLAANCIHNLASRGAIAHDALGQYIAALGSAQQQVAAAPAA
ncbi:MAG TPA: FkbM family methyltransferase [Pseudolabrys sp.]